MVVPTRDRPEHLAACLAALCASTAPGDEIIVVDSCSKSAATSEVSNAHGVRLVRCDRPGASRARNVGWRAAGNDIVAFVDDDVRVSPTWAKALHEAFAAHPEASFIAGRLALREEDAGAERPVAFFDAVSAFVIDEAVVDEWGHGANLAVRRDALVAVGGYDERLGPGTPWPAAEDRELVDRIVGSGYRGRYEPAVSAVHVQWRRRPQLLRLEWTYGVGLGARLFRLRGRNRRRYEVVSRIAWREQGLDVLLRCLRAGYEFEALSVLIRLAGTAVGLVSSPLSTFSAGRSALGRAFGRPQDGRGPRLAASPIGESDRRSGGL